MSGPVFANNATSALAGSIADDAVSLTVTTGQGSRFPAPAAGEWFPLTVIDPTGTFEIMKCTDRTGDVFTVERAQEGTAAAAFAAGARVAHRVTAAALASCMFADLYDPSGKAEQVLTVGDTTDNNDLSSDGSKLAMRKNVAAFMEAVADDSALAARSISVNNAVYNLGNQGWWLPTTDDISAEITGVDPRYIAAAADVTGASGGWYRAGSVQDGFFWREEGARVPVPIADRVMVGDAVTYTGNKSPNPLGGDWLSEYGANYFIKNSHMAVLTTGHYAFLAAAQAAAGSSTGGGGVFAVALNRGNSAFVRAIYAEAMHMPGNNAGGTGGIEVQVGNYSGVDITPNPYNLGGGGAAGVSIGAESGYNYQLGDANTPLTAPTLPAAVALTVAGGSIAAAYQRFRVGMVFSTNALYRDVDGLTGKAAAINMAQGHEITWASANSLTRQVFMRSDVTAVSGDVVGVLFANRKITLCGASERAIATFNDDHGGAGAVNWLKFTNSRTAVSLSIAADGSDTNIGVQVTSKGTGVIQFLSHGGSGEHFRVAPASQAVNYISVTGGTTGLNPRLAAAGTDTNVSAIVRGKGTGGVRLEDGGSAAKIEVNTTGIGFFAATPVAQKTMAAATGTATRTAFDTATVTLPELAERVKALIDDLRSFGTHA